MLTRLTLYVCVLALVTTVLLRLDAAEQVKSEPVPAKSPPPPLLPSDEIPPLIEPKSQPSAKKEVPPLVPPAQAEPLKRETPLQIELPPKREVPTLQDGRKAKDTPRPRMEEVVPSRELLPRIPMETVPVTAKEPAPLDIKERLTPMVEIVPVARREGAAAATTLRAGFFNHTDREIELEIDQKAVRLPSLHYLLVKVPREFTWREKEGKAQSVVIPGDADGVEVIFRR